MALIKEKPLDVFLAYVKLTIGSVIYCLGWTSFMIPNGFVDGGLTGFSAILEFGTGIPTAYTYFIINVIMLVVATIILGRAFGIRTVYVIVLTTLLFRFLPQWDWILSLPGHFFFVSEKVLVAMIGGFLEALGISMVLSNGGSTGGTDIIAVVVNKFWPVSLGRVFLWTDIVVISSLLLLPDKSFNEVVYGYVTMITFALSIDLVLMGRKSTVQIMIFSDKYSEIAEYINKEMERGVTALNAVGWFTQKDRKVLLVVVRNYEMSEITKAVKTLDPKAFVSVVAARDVYGEGFDELKTGISRKKKQQ